MSPVEGRKSKTFPLHRLWSRGRLEWGPSEHGRLVGHSPLWAGQAVQCETLRADSRWPPRLHPQAHRRLCPLPALRLLPAFLPRFRAPPSGRRPSSLWPPCQISPVGLIALRDPAGARPSGQLCKSPPTLSPTFSGLTALEPYIGAHAGFHGGLYHLAQHTQMGSRESCSLQQGTLELPEGASQQQM